MVAFYRAEESTFSDREQELFAVFCSAFAEDLLPFLRRCLQVLFPPAQLALVLGELPASGPGSLSALAWLTVVCGSAGVPPTQLHRCSGLGGLDVPAVLEPLRFLLPEREAWPPEPALPEVDPTCSDPTPSSSAPRDAAD